MLTTVPLADSVFDGAKEVFETMIFMSLEKAADAEMLSSQDCLLGNITFKGNLEGCLAVCFSIDCAKSIAANMLGLEPGAQISETEITDAAGEVANMVMGSFKTRVLAEIGSIEVSIPSVVHGSNLQTMLSEGQNRVTIPITIDEYAAKLILLYKFNPGY